MTAGPRVSRGDPGTSSSRWERSFGLLPFALLALATLVGLLTQRLLGNGLVSTVWLIALAAASAGWMAGWTPAHRAAGGWSRALVAMYVGRSMLAFALSWINPFLAIFAVVGYVDAPDVFRGRTVYVAVFSTAVVLAGSQSGGLPPDGRVGWAVFLLMVLLNTVLASAFTVFHDRVASTSEARASDIVELERVNAELMSALAENQTLQHTVVGQARAAGVQQERQRLAAEIHDTLAQGLAGIVSQLGATRDEPSSVWRRLDVVERLARESLVEARRSVRELSPAPLEDATLPGALQALVDEWTGDGSAEAALVVTGDPIALHPDVEATVLRIAQEALTNARKHAGAGRVGLTLSYLDDEVILDVRDDGRGFDPCAAEPPDGFGLRGMRARARRVAGVLEVESEPGRGTSVSARLPAVRQESPT